MNSRLGGILENARQISANNSFSANFHDVDDLGVCADAINRPHEDYPQRVSATAKVLETVVDLFEFEHRKDRTLGVDAFIMRQIHGMIFNDEAHGGTWRQIHTHPYGKAVDTYADPLHIEELIEQITPLYPWDFDVYEEKDELIEALTGWYEGFQTIHPFEDGNGRTGGVVVAAIAQVSGGIWLAPKQ